MIALSNIAQGSAVLAMIYINRKNEEEKQVSIPAAISCYLGVTEPAMFGINLKYGFPFLAAMIGSMVAAVISVGSDVMANSIGVGGTSWIPFYPAAAYDDVCSCHGSSDCRSIHFNNCFCKNRYE